MAFKYNETAGPGSIWTRCSGINIDNRHGVTPIAQFTESTVSEVGGKSSEQFAGVLSSGFNPTATIALRDPDTGQATGNTVTQAHLYQVLFSLYMQLVDERDGN